MLRCSEYKPEEKGDYPFLDLQITDIIDSTLEVASAPSQINDDGEHMTLFSEYDCNKIWISNPIPDNDQYPIPLVQPYVVDELTLLNKDATTWEKVVTDILKKYLNEKTLENKKATLGEAINVLVKYSDSF